MQDKSVKRIMEVLFEDPKERSEAALGVATLVYQLSSSIPDENVEYLRQMLVDIDVKGHVDEIMSDLENEEDDDDLREGLAIYGGLVMVFIKTLVDLLSEESDED